MQFLLLLVSFAGIAAAQFRSGLEGIIKDSSDAALAGAQVTATNEQTQVRLETTSNDAGFFRISQLAPGQYRVEVSHSGFKSWVQSGLALEGSEIRTLYPVLQLGEQKTVVEVEAALAAVDTVTGKVTRSIEQKTIEEIPMVGRNVYGAVAALAPGITGSGGLFGGASGSGSLGQDSFQLEPGFQINAAGQRQETNEYQVDGTSVNGNSRDGIVNLTPQPDTIQEVRVSANAMSADKGRNSGALVEVYTKSGTNQFHGTLSEFHSDNRLASRSVFQRTIPVFRRNEYGLTLGGPVIKNRTFFFGSLYKLSSSVGQTDVVRIETPEFRDYVSRTFPNSIANRFLQKAPSAAPPTSDIWTIARVRQTNPGRFPDTFPDTLPAVGTAFVDQTLARPAYQFSTRVDHNFRSYKDRIYGNWYRTRSRGQQPSARPLFRVVTPNDGEFLRLNYTSTLRPALLNQASFSFVRAAGGNPGTENDKNLPNVSITGLQGFSQGGPLGWAHNNYAWSDVMSWIRGNHQVKFGADIDRQTGWQNQERTNLRPSFTFQNMLDFAQDLPFSQTGPALNTRTNGLGTGLYRFIHMFYLGGFVQDDWKVSRKLTLNLGLRYDYFGHWATARNRDIPFPIFTPGSGSTLQDQIVNGAMQVRGGNGSFITNSPQGVSPRFGFAWDLFGNGTMALRGGYGLFLSRVANLSFVTPNQVNPPDFAIPSLSVQQGNQFSYALALDAEGAQWRLPPGVQFQTRPDGSIVGLRSNAGGLTQELKQPLTHNWTLSLQKRVGGNIILEADYLGTYSNNLYTQTEINRFAGDLVRNSGRLTRLNQNFNSIIFGRTLGESWGNIGSFMVGRRFSKGYSLRGIYTIGRALDYVSSNDNGVGGGRNVLDAFNIGLQKGRADYNIARRLAIDSVWELPNPWKDGFKSRVIGGWRLSGIAILQSGRPFTVISSAPYPNGDFNADGFNWDTPDTPSFGNYVSTNRSGFINGLFRAADFPRPTGGRNGTLGRNTFDGPGLANVNLGVEKNFTIPWFISEKATVEIRGEIFNLFNRVNLTLPSSDLTSGLFGRSTDQSLPRGATIGIRIQY